MTDSQRFVFEWEEEDLEVEQLEEGRFRLFHSSLSDEMLRWGDIIEAEFTAAAWSRHTAAGLPAKGRSLARASRESGCVP